MSMNKKNSAAIYLMIAAAVLVLIGVFFYQTATVTVPTIVTLSIVVVVLTAIAAALVFLKKELPVLNLCATVIAVLLAWTLIQSVTAQLDPLGFWVSGLYTFDQVRGYIIFAVLAGVALILDVIATFIDLKKD